MNPQNSLRAVVRMLTPAGIMNALRLGLTAMALACTTNWANPAFPFVLPWDDSLPEVATDFSGMNHPIGPADRIGVDAAGHFAAKGERVRFIGVNFAGDSPFMPTNKADAVAARLAKFGVNCVRFHHMEASWAYKGGLLAYTSESSTNINSSQLEKVHFVVSRLKAHGIYSDINLLVGRAYRSGDGLGADVAAMDWKDAHILGFFNDTALALQQDYATRLLTPINPFTGLSLAQDPAVAFVEIINENGLIHKWLDGGLDRLPATYAAQLRPRWNIWLAARYPDASALGTAWQVIDQPLGANRLKNGSFANGLSNWNAEQHETARATVTPTDEFKGGAPSVRIEVTRPGTAAWHVQFNQAGLSVTRGGCYTISFWAKSSAATRFEAAVSRAHDDYAGVGFGRTFALTPHWQHFTQSFEATATDANVRVNFSGMGLERGTFWLADVRLQPGGQIGQLPPGATLAAGTVPILTYAGAGYTGTRAARQDWLRFLRDLESQYYDRMVAHIRERCGFAGLIFGTIMANSPATVQSRMDVIDGHAYWQHPQFPGRDWDSVNWRVPNLSLVNTLGDDNTIAGLARQRIQGKPFVVTEYNHPQPNYYGAEAPVLLAAYGALQDWDGFWMFDYGPGQDGTARMGSVHGFFDTAQHSGKMANLLLAATCFAAAMSAPSRTKSSSPWHPTRRSICSRAPVPGGSLTAANWGFRPSWRSPAA